MKAVICKVHGPPESLVVEEIPPPTPGKGQAVVSVKAAGVNFPNTLIILADVLHVVSRPRRSCRLATR